MYPKFSSVEAVYLTDGPGLGSIDNSKIATSEEVCERSGRGRKATPPGGRAHSSTGEMLHKHAETVVDVVDGKTVT